MAKVLITEQYLTNIANAIRTKAETADTFFPSEMAQAIMGIDTTGFIPTGTISITSNNTYDVTNYASAEVNVPIGSTINNQNKSVTPTESQQSITADSGYTGLGTVTVGAISSTYVGSGIDQLDSSDLTVSGATVSVPAGYYNTAASKSVASGSVTAPSTISGTAASVSTGTNTLTLTKTVSVTPSVTTAGYVSSGTAGNSSVSLTASVTINPTPTASGATVTIPEGYYSESTTKTISSGSATTPATTIDATQNISIDTSTGEITATASGSKSVTPTVSAGYVSTGTAGTITVNGSDTLQLTIQAAKTITPTESSQTAVAKNVYTTGVVTVGAISSTYVGSGITQRDSGNLTVSGATVTAPAGYYSAAASKSVTTMTLPTAASSSATSGYRRKATIARSTSVQYINIAPGYNSEGGYYQISATPNGSATTPATTITANPTITVSSSGLITATTSASQNITPTVSAGYVSSGTAGTVTVSGSKTQQLTTKAAATITPTTTNQTIAAGTYLTGAQTIQGDADLVGSNILATANIFGVQGMVTFQSYYTGSSAPASSLGNNGDIYLQE